MTEKEYIRVSHLAKVRSALKVLHDVTPDLLESDEERERFQTAYGNLTLLETDLSKRVKIRT